MSHDGGPSPMYWVIWLVFQNLQTFPGIPGVPVLLQTVGWILDGLDVTWTSLDVTGGVWMSLGMSGQFQVIWS